MYSTILPIESLETYMCMMWIRDIHMVVAGLKIKWKHVVTFLE